MDKCTSWYASEYLYNTIIKQGISTIDQNIEEEMNEDLHPAVMLTALLNSPDPDSHQYTASLCHLSILHVDPVIVPQVVQSDRCLSSVNLFTLHSVEFPSQLSETESEVKC